MTGSRQPPSLLRQCHHSSVSRQGSEPDLAEALHQGLPETRIQSEQYVVSRLVGRSQLRSLRSDIWETHEIGSEASDNTVDRVKNRSMENCEAPRRMDGGGLGTGSPHDD